MRIAVLNIQVPFIKGGAEVLAEDLIRELNKRGHDTELITIPFVASPIINRLKNIEFWKELDLKTSFNGKIDKVIALKWPTYAAQHDNMTLWLLHQHRVVYDLWDNQAVNSLSSQKDGLKLKEEITSFDTKYIGSLKNRFTISRNVSNRLKKFNGIDSEVLYPPPPKQESFRCSEYGDFIFFPSRILSLKRQELVIQALAHTNTACTVYFAGSPDIPEYLEKLKQLTKELKVEHKVRWLGRVSDEEKIDLYAKCKCVIYPPIDEDYGYITPEAMLSSKSVISCFDSGGPLEFIVQNETGLITLPNPEDLAVAMDRYYSNEKLAKTLGQQSKRKIDQMPLNWDHVIDNLTKD